MNDVHCRILGPGDKEGQFLFFVCFARVGRADHEGSEIIAMRSTHLALVTVCGFSCLIFKQHLP